MSLMLVMLNLLVWFMTFFIPIFFFFNDTATTEIYTLSLHDALPICTSRHGPWRSVRGWFARSAVCRSEEHTSELQSLAYLVCRLLLEKKNGSLMLLMLRMLLWLTSNMRIQKSLLKCN